jgi:hypothetical protein
MLAVLKNSRWSAEFICAHRWDVLFAVGTSSFREFAAVSGADKRLQQRRSEA